MKLKRPLIVTIVVLPIIGCLWYFSLLPAAWGFVKEAGLVGWVFYMVIEWLVSRESSRQKAERLAQIGRAEAERKQELEEIDRRRRDIYDAIKEWVQPPQARWQIGGQQEPLYLAERVPMYAQKIDDCLSRNYSSIWGGLREYRAKYAELRALDTSIPDEFREKTDTGEIVRLWQVDARKGSMRSQLLEMQCQLVQQINLEIVEKHDTELKC